MEGTDDDVPLILTWDDATSGLLSEETERGDEMDRKKTRIFSRISGAGGVVTTLRPGRRRLFNRQWRAGHSKGRPALKHTAWSRPSQAQAPAHDRS
ncbi:hypothetical protein J4Q44_G00165890 [Coregonus suidteri]|uniref:Uncharacterized protein n=1 Tax=Coregonus suidteri TaxID=861788 RepID=A0AAN8LRT3_9TELE